MPEKIPERLIIRYLTNEASAEEQHALFEWVNHHAENQSIFQEYVESWKKKSVVHDAYDVGKGLRQLNRKIEHLEKAHAEVRLFPWVKVAAAVALLIITGAAVIMGLQKISINQNEVTYLERTADRGERISLTLDDGTTIRLNARSSVRYPSRFTGSRREVFLTGEAFFDVKKDLSRPFVIHTGNLITEVLGTSFNVKSLPGSVSVAVASGKVKVYDGTLTEIILPEHKVTYNTVTAAMKKERAVLGTELAWINNTIIFDDTPVEAAAATLEDWYGVSIVFDNNAIKKCVISGTFKNESLEHILDAIAFSVDLRYKRTGKEITLSGKGCE